MSSSKPQQLSPLWRGLISIVVVVQLLAVVAEPFRFFTRSSRGTSPAADPMRWFLGPYIEFAYLNHGYFFFAPEPGPSHLIDCTLKQSDGTEKRIRFPDRNLQWPRLLYHRHFMLTENLHQLWVPPLARDAIPPGDRRLQDWKTERERYNMIVSSMQRHLENRYAAEFATIERVEHRLPSDEEIFRQQMKLNDPRLYVPLPDVQIEQEIGPEATRLPVVEPEGQMPLEPHSFDATLGAEPPAQPGVEFAPVDPGTAEEIRP